MGEEQLSGVLVALQHHINPSSQAISCAWEITFAILRQIPMNNIASVSTSRRVH